LSIAELVAESGEMLKVGPDPDTTNAGTIAELDKVNEAVGLTTPFESRPTQERVRGPNASVAPAMNSSFGALGATPLTVYFSATGVPGV
jgi:hypothetical protein